MSEKETKGKDNKASKEKSAKKNNKKTDKPNIFVRMLRGIVKFFKDFKAESKKITWTPFKSVLRNTGVVFAVSLVVGIGVWLVDYGLSYVLSLLKDLAA